MDARIFLRALAVQAACVLVLFALLALTVPDGFFEDYGAVSGPAAWIVCSAITWRILSLPAVTVVLAAIAGGLAGVAAFVVVGHSAGLVAALLAFAASCALHGRPAALARGQ